MNHPADHGRRLCIMVITWRTDRVSRRMDVPSRVKRTGEDSLLGNTHLGIQTSDLTTDLGAESDVT